MPSPVRVMPRAHDGLGTNPWIDTSDTFAVEPEIKSPATRTTLSRKRCHIRSQTTAGHPLHTPSSSDDEAQVGLGRGTSLDLHETRPSLRRILNAGRNFEEDESQVSTDDECPVGHNGKRVTKEAEAEVIVHQIQLGDSLPGVALKYNISLAALRNTNKLWASDSIHLRQVLYIPIKVMATAASASHTPQERPDLPSHSAQPSPDIHTRPSSHIRRSSSNGEETHMEAKTPRPSEAHTISAGSTSTIRRVPLSELSFFPPPSTSALAAPKPIIRPPVPGSSPSRSSTNLPLSLFHSPPALGLTNFLNGAKDEIIGRLSFDSTRGSSDTGEEHELELDVVRPDGKLRRRSSANDGEWSRVREFVSRSNGTVMEMDILAERGRESVILDTPRKPKVVRTVQLQPSPKMVIPPRSTGSKPVNGFA